VKRFRFLPVVFVGLALLLHFRVGIWSEAHAQSPEAKSVETPKETPKEAPPEEAKSEEAKPDNTGSTTLDASAVDGYKKLDPKKLDTDTIAANEQILADGIGKNRAAINMMWTLITGFLVMFMQAGFALVETGLTRAKNVAHTMAMNVFIYAIGVLAFYFVGFGLMFGGSDATWFGGAKLLNQEYTLTLMGKPFGLFGQTGFWLAGRTFDVTILTIFLFQMVFMDTAATIPTGALAERWKFLAFTIYGFFMAGLIYPIYGNWVWGGGWLAKLGQNFGLGHGHVDFAGSSVVHMTGGVCALAGVLIVGPRLGKYNKDGSVNVLPAHNVPMYVLGTLILAFGWFGFNPGSTLAASDLNIGRIAVNTMLASAAGAFACTIYMWLVYKKPDVSFMCNGLLAGLVAVTAPCAFVTPIAAVLIGAVAGILVIWSALFWERIMKIDDPVGAISVHGVNGAWGVLALGLLADGTYGQGFNSTYWYRISGSTETRLVQSDVELKGIKPDTGGTANEALVKLDDENKEKKPGEAKLVAPDFLKKLAPDVRLEQQGVTGLLYGNTSQFLAQTTGMVTNVVFVLLASLLVFFLIELAVGNRVSREVELQGLDIHEMGAPGYFSTDADMPETHRPAAVPLKPVVKPAADGRRRFTLAVEGIAPEKIATVWSELCQPTAEKPSPEFRALYAKMTTFQGNRFRFMDGNPAETADRLTRVLRSKVPDADVTVDLVT
jgi:ammonium transporter, Amt family